MSPKKGGLKDKINAALERGNAGRQAKLSAKADVSAAQGNLKKSAKLEMKSKKVALRSEKRQAISDAKKNMKNGTTPKLMMKSTSKPNTSSMNDKINKFKATGKIFEAPKTEMIFKSGASQNAMNKIKGY